MVVQWRYMKKQIFTAALVLLLVPAVVLAQVLFPNRGGTGTSDAPGSDQLLIGNGSTYDLKTLTAGENVTIDTSGSTISITASLEGGGLASTDIDTEAELEAIITDVSDLFTNNDGALSDDDLSDNSTSDLSEGTNLYYTDERAEDAAGGMVTGNTETLITVTYQDADGTFDFAVEQNLSNFTNDAGFVTSANDTVSGSELDGVFSTNGLLKRTGGDTYTTVTDNSSDWDTAFGWGDHRTQGYLTSSPFGASIGPTELRSTDFGDFTCNGTSCSLDATYLTGNETITLSGDVTGSGATAITTALAAGSVSDNEIDYTTVTLNDLTFDVGSVSKTEFGYLNGVSSAIQTQLNSKFDALSDFTGTLTDGRICTYDSSGGEIDCNTVAGGSGDNVSVDGGAVVDPDFVSTGDIDFVNTSNTITGDINTGAVQDAEIDYSAVTLADFTNDAGFLTTVDISADTNLTAGRSLTLTGDSVAADAELYTDSVAIYIEDPTDTDDIASWFENDFGKTLTITEISCESDQTVNFDVQVDDGTPADVNGTDIACTSSGVDDTSFAGDTTIADNDTLDLAIASVSGSPTWVRISVTYTIAD